MTDDNSAAPIFEQLARQNRIADILSNTLAAHGLPTQIGRMDIQVHDQYVNEITGTGSKISNRIYDHMFPKKATPIEVWHYTSPDGFKGIVDQGELRLFSLKKWIEKDCGEIETFAEKHGLRGYLADSGAGPFYKKLAEDLHYASFTPLVTPASDEAKMWEFFGDDRQGARLKLRITLPSRPHCGELREIQYESQNRTLLNEINDALHDASEGPFLAWTTSRVGAFYLPDDLKIENEIRLLAKYHDGMCDMRRPVATKEYWPVPIGLPNIVAQIDLIAVEMGTNADKADLLDAMNKSRFAGKPIS